MNIVELTQAVVNLGFPCVMCLLLLRHINSMQSGLVESINALTVLVKEVNDKIERN